ncbi:phosphatidylcholine and lysophosphatidylcholine phospholipase [Entophlyctis luteolus]|nr:phosphatidylcholine and lysophosphatidylcholine phospholipase [Entophlyctis luteolus]
MSIPVAPGGGASGASLPVAGVVAMDIAAETVTVWLPVVIGLVVIAVASLIFYVRFVHVRVFLVFALAFPPIPIPIPSQGTKYSRLPPAQPLPNAKYSEAPFDLRIPSVLPTQDEQLEDALSALYTDDHARIHRSKQHYTDVVDVLRDVKVFGYLDRPVINELAKHLITRKVRAGSVVFDADDASTDADPDFCIVLDGLVSVYVKPPASRSNASARQTTSAFAYTHGFDSGSDFDPEFDFDDSGSVSSSEDNGLAQNSQKRTRVRLSGHHLLSKVKRGGVVSSLFSVIGTLTESVELPNFDDDAQPSNSSPTENTAAESNSPQGAGPTAAQNLVTSNFRDSPIPLSTFEGTTLMPISTLTSHTPESAASEITSPPRQSSLHHSIPFPQTSAARVANNVHPPRVVSVATTDVKLLVLPASAFRALRTAASLRRSSRTSGMLRMNNHQMQMPQLATPEGYVTLAHVAQIIITRFLRVTVFSMERYLGLKSELLAVERSLSGGNNGAKLETFLVERVRKRAMELRKETFESSGGGLMASMPHNLNSNEFAVEDDDIRTRNHDALENASDTGFARRSPKYSTIITGQNTNRTDISGIRRRFAATRSTLEVDGSESDTSAFFKPLPQSKTAAEHAGPSKRSTMLEQTTVPVQNKLKNLQPKGNEARLPIPLPSLKTPTRLVSPQNQSFPEQKLPQNIRAKHADVGTPGVVLEPEMEEDKQLADSIFNAISLIIGISSQNPALPASTGSSTEYSLNRRRISVDSIDSSTDDTDSALSATSSDFSGSPYNSKSLMGPRFGGKDVIIVSLNRGDVLVKEGERVSGFWFVIDGILEASVKDPSKTRKKGVFLIKPGNLAGYLAAVTGHASLVTIKAKTDAQVGFVRKATVEKFVEKFPSVMLTLAKRIQVNISPLAYQIDFALDWTHLIAGGILYRQDTRSDSIYIIISGRLRSIGEHYVTAPQSTEKTSRFEIYGEFGPGESLGELEVLTETPRPTTVHAIRDSQVAVLPKTLFNALAIRHPEITIQISRMLAARSAGGAVAGMAISRVNLNPFGGAHAVEGLIAGAASGAVKANPAFAAPLRSPTVSGVGGGHRLMTTGSGADSGKNNFNLKTVGILPVNALVPIGAFAERLKEGLELVGASVALLNSAAVMGKLGRHVFSALGRLKLMAWLAEQEDVHRLVLYVADGGIGSQWTLQCIRQADCILLVGLGDEDPAIGEFERLVLSVGTTARKELILLHNERHCAPGSTASWLKSRLWIHAHHHVQMPLTSRKIINTNGRKSTLMDLQAHFQRFYTQATGRLLNPNPRTSPTAHTGIRSDFARIARRLLNKSIGLALGGGGARGIAHVSIIRAFEEAGIPIDMISGTSIGSFVGGLYARENDHVSIYGRAKQLSSAMSSKWRQFIDLTYPLTSLFTGHELNRAVWKCFLETQIEDCWIPFSAITVNITDSRIEVHRSGYMWRYVRASMSLAGYFPPLCDDGKLLVDGGYLNLVPVDVVINQGADVAIGVDVSVWNDTSPVTYGDSLSGIWLFFARFVPGLTTAKYGRIPLLPDIQDRLAFAGSVDKLEKVKNGEFYLHPPVSNFGAVDFQHYKTIYEIGYKYGKELVRKWEKDGTLERRFGIVKEKGGGARRGNRRASI